MAKINMEKYRQKQWEIQQAAIKQQEKAQEALERQKAEQQETIDELQQVIDTAYGIISQHGEASAALAAEMYNSIARKEGADVPEADPAEVAPYEEVAKAIAGTTSEQHPGVVGRFVKQAGEDTMLQNAARDGAEFAWTPGGRGCAFCLMLASRGWQRVSKRTLRKIGPDGRWIHAEHIHPHCKCDYSIRFNEDTEVEGYDPDGLREQYENADGKDWREKMKNAFGLMKDKQDDPDVLRLTNW